MDHKLSVLVQVDLGETYVRLLVTGCLTEANQQTLHRVVTRARTLIPAATVTVDLTAADHLEASAVEQLTRALGQDASKGGASPVEILTSDSLPDHEPAPARMIHHMQAGRWWAA